MANPLIVKQNFSLKKIFNLHAIVVTNLSSTINKTIKEMRMLYWWNDLNVTLLYTNI